MKYKKELRELRELMIENEITSLMLSKKIYVSDSTVNSRFHKGVSNKSLYLEMKEAVESIKLDKPIMFFKKLSKQAKGYQNIKDKTRYLSSIGFSYSEANKVIF